MNTEANNLNNMSSVPTGNVNVVPTMPMGNTQTVPTMSNVVSVNNTVGSIVNNDNTNNQNVNVGTVPVNNGSVNNQGVVQPVNVSVAQAPTVTVVDNAQNATVSNNIEATISVDNSGKVDPISLEYNEYRKDLNKIYATTTDENSLVSKFIIENGKCNHTLVIKYSNGTVSTEKSHVFDYTENFKNDFLAPMLEDYNKYNTIFDDSVVIKDNSLATFTARTKDNDSLIIENINMDVASKLSDLVKRKDNTNPNLTDSNTIKQVYNEHGLGNTSVIILTIILIGMTVIGTIFFTVMANK